MSRIILFLALFFAAPLSSWGQAYFTYPENHNTRYIHANEENFSLTSEAMLWVDHQDIHPTLEEVHHGELRDQFQKWPDTHPQWNNGKDQWIRLSAYNSSSEDRQWTMHLGQSDWATIWILPEQGKLKKYDSGELHSYENQSWINKNGKVSIPVEIEARKAITVYARMSNNGAAPPLLTPYLQSNSNWELQQQKELFLQLLLLAVLMIVLGVGLPALIWQRQVAHVLFAFFSLLFTTWILHEYGYIRVRFLEGLPMVNWRVGTMAFLFMQPLFLLFLYSKLEEKLPMLQLWVGVRLSLSLALGTLTLLEMPIPLEWAMKAFWIFDSLIIAYCGIKGNEPIMKVGYMQDRWTMGTALWLYVFLMLGSLLDSMSLRWGTSLGQPYSLYAYQLGGVGASLMYIWSTLRYAVSPTVAYPLPNAHIQSERAYR